MSKEPLFREAAAAYAFGGKILSIAPFGSGHINDTYRVVCPDARIPFTLFAAREMPSPVPQIRIPWSTSPDTTARATRSP